MDKLVLVTGATGQQGGAVAAKLLAGGWRVRALTRDPGGEKARALAAAGAEIVSGRLEDEATINGCLQDVYGVFSVHPGPLSPDQDEVRAGKIVADAAKSHGVTHVVYSSAIGADLMQAAKWEVEQYLFNRGISATVLRPTSFMENYYDPRFGMNNGVLRTALAPHIRQQLIALDDIAALTVSAFEHPEQFRGKTLELAGDELTPGEIAAAISRATGTTVPYDQLPIEELRRINERFARGYEYLNSDQSPKADIASLRELHPALMTFDAWLAHTGAARFKELLG